MRDLNALYKEEGEIVEKLPIKEIKDRIKDYEDTILELQTKIIAGKKVININIWLK